MVPRGDLEHNDLSSCYHNQKNTELHIARKTGKVQTCSCCQSFHRLSSTLAPLAYRSLLCLPLSLYFLFPFLSFPYMYRLFFSISLFIYLLLFSFLVLNYFVLHQLSPSVIFSSSLLLFYLFFFSVSSTFLILSRSNTRYSNDPSSQHFSELFF